MDFSIASILALDGLTNGAIYGLADDRCSCSHSGPSLCVHQLAMRIRRIAIGRVLLREVGLRGKD